jgi:hypothetical protein
MEGCLTRLTKPPGARAAALLERLDERYLEFVRSLSPLLAKSAVQYSTFAGRPSQEPLEGLSRMNAVIACIPWLFWESFRQLPDDLFLQTAEAGALFGMASVLVDHLIDGQVGNPGEALLLHQALYAAGVAGYRCIFPGTSAFWHQFDRLADEHLSGMTLELAGRIDPGGLTPQAFYTLASARIAPMITVVAALAEVTGEPSLLPPVEASVKAVIVAGQLLDDIGDWKDDLEAGRINFYLARLCPPGTWLTGEMPPQEQLQDAIDADWRDVEGLGMVMDWFQKGLSAVQDLECSAWVEYVEGYRALTQRLLTASVTRHLARSLRPLAQVPAG